MIENLHYLLKYSFQGRKYFLNFSYQKDIFSFFEDLFNFLFNRSPFILEKSIFREFWKKMNKRFCNILSKIYKNTLKCKFISQKFLEKIPNIYEKLIFDAKAISQFDPAIDILEEIFLSHSGFFAIAFYRFSHELWNKKIPLIPNIISNFIRSKTGIEINPEACIGKYLVIDHGSGIVIGSSSCIGNHVKIYQGVTLGSIKVKKSLANKKRHPTIEDNVIIYVGSIILGGNTIIGNNSVIGGKSWITQSIPPFSIVYQKSIIKIRINEIAKHFANSRKNSSC